MIERCRLRPSDQVLEVGPGRGALTEPLSGLVGRLVAVELDRQLAGELQDRYGERQEIHIVPGDMRRLRLTDLPLDAERPIRVVSNLPYASATAILRHLLEERSRIHDFVIMVQKEVADRMLAAEGGSERGFLSILVQLLTEPQRLFTVPPGAFRPRPKVSSTVLRLKVRRKAVGGVGEAESLLRLASTGFANRRKTLGGNLRRAYGDALRDRWEDLAQRAGVPPLARAQELSIAQWGRLLGLLGAPPPGSGKVS
jgi:16S rRNA (adenine1518-N6/adenine1519-N6)-dimethyltransferase